MVLALALELAPIRVNAVSPGWVDTPVWDRLATPDVKNARMADLAARLPARRLGRPEDIANAVAFLIADTFMTGTVLPPRVPRCSCNRPGVTERCRSA
jgi:NAD(P)-dependent dehydrogenase (short-subunit alcohol dehydrogenase family)